MLGDETIMALLPLLLIQHQQEPHMWGVVKKLFSANRSIVMRVAMEGEHGCEAALGRGPSPAGPRGSAPVHSSCSAQAVSSLFQLQGGNAVLGGKGKWLLEPEGNSLVYSCSCAALIGWAKSHFYWSKHNARTAFVRAGSEGRTRGRRLCPAARLA